MVRRYRCTGSTIDLYSAKLTERAWTESFSFRPTFENVAHWLCEMLVNEVPQLLYVELDNETIGVTTRYDNALPGLGIRSN